MSSSLTSELSISDYEDDHKENYDSINLHYSVITLFNSTNLNNFIVNEYIFDGGHGEILHFYIIIYQ